MEDLSTQLTELHKQEMVLDLVSPCFALQGYEQL